MTLLSGWGRYPKTDCRVVPLRGEADAHAALAMGAPLIARGNGRAYGDAALQPQGTLDYRPCDRLLDFDAATGTLTCEAGVLLADILTTFMPRGWFPPVTPGTKFVTVGGMVAADVHGKNHHGAGSFGRHVLSLDLLHANGETVTCSATEHSDLFAATCGGMGLTGIILRATFRLIPIATRYIRQTTIRTPTLAATMDAFEQNRAATYSVAWIDCLSGGTARGRGIVTLGEHAAVTDLKDSAAPLVAKPRRRRTVPFDLPALALNGFSVRAFNALYYRLPRSAQNIVDYDPFFYPLDALHDWNRIYGKRGFLQYQCVLPLVASRAGMAELLTAIGASGQGSFLAVLKLLGPAAGPLSFPMEGYTLALDFPVRDGVFDLLDRLDAITQAHGGRVYLAKDARAQPGAIIAGYPRLAEFQQARDARFASLLSERLKL